MATSNIFFSVDKAASFFAEEPLGGKGFLELKTGQFKVY